MSFLCLRLSLGMSNDFLLSSTYAVALHVFNNWTTIGGKEKNESMEARCWPFKSSRSHFSLRERVLPHQGDRQQQWPPASVTAPLRQEAAISNQVTDLPYLEDRVLFQIQAPQNHASCSRDTCTTVCHSCK